MSIYMVNKHLPWDVTPESVRQHVAAMLLPSDAERVWAYTRIWLVSYIFAGRGGGDLFALFDALRCRPHLHAHQIDATAHLLPLGVRTSATQAEHARLLLPRTPIEHALHHGDVETFRFLMSRGAPLDRVYFDALGCRHREIALLAARAFSLPHRSPPGQVPQRGTVRLPMSCLLSVELIKLLINNGMLADESSLHLHCDSAATFRWCERNLSSSACFSTLTEDHVQLMVHAYVVHNALDIAEYLLSKPAFLALFPVNRTMYALLGKTSPDAVRLLQLVYSRRPAPITFDSGLTMLQHVAQTGNVAMARALLDLGEHAFRSQTNSFPLLSTLSILGHRTAAAHARENHHAALAEIIDTYRAADPYLAPNDPPSAPIEREDEVMPPEKAAEAA